MRIRLLLSAAIALACIDTCPAFPAKPWRIIDFGPRQP